MNHGTISPEIAKGLKVLRSRIAKAKIPSSKLDETLNIATWNICEFGKKARSEAAIYCDALADAGGNDERIGFIYDKRAVAFTGFAASATPPRTKVGDLYLPQFDWWREPFMASFSAGHFDFVLLAAHAQWGTPAGRTAELKSLAEWVDLKKKEK